MELNGSGTHSSLLWYGNNYSHKKFYSTCPELFSSFFQPILMFAGKVGAYQRLAVANTLAYYEMATITAKKAL